jgi:ATP-dependent DNA ligase
MEQLVTMLASRKVTGNAAIEHLQYVLENVTAENAKVLERVIQKDPDCGASDSTVNKVWPGLIRSYPVMLCSAYDQKIVDRLHWQKGVYVQLKSDGMRCNIVVDKDNVTVYTRNGREVETHGVFDHLKKLNKRVVIDGELLVRDKNGKFLDRKTGNGICNKALKGTVTKAEAEAFFLSAWDLIPLDDFRAGLCTDTYKIRFTYLLGVVGDIEEYQHFNVGIIESNVVHSLEEAQAIFESYLAKGEEGAILKDKTANWEDKRSKQLVKLKAELDADLKVIDVKAGTGKYEGQIGALICTDSSGKLNVSVGSGLSDEQRKTLVANELIGKIVTVTYNAKIQAKDGTWSLFLPRLVEIREDKNDANNFNDIK